jgi:hypothetical protein
VARMTFWFEVEEEEIPLLFEALCVPAGLEVTPENAYTMARNHVMAPVKYYLAEKEAAAARANAPEVKIY